jgi:hypothetical protein
MPIMVKLRTIVIADGNPAIDLPLWCLSVGAAIGHRYQLNTHNAMLAMKTSKRVNSFVSVPGELLRGG